MAEQNVAKTQNAEVREGVESYSTAEYVTALAPGWRVPLVRLTYSWQDDYASCKCFQEVTFGVAAVAGVETMILPVIGRKKEFVAGTDLAQLLEAADATEADYIDVWRTTAVKDVWQDEGKARRHIAGTVQRYYPAEQRWDGTIREVDRDIAVLVRDVKRHGLNPQKTNTKVAAKKAPSRGCEVARMARERQAGRAANAKKPATWRNKDKGVSSLLELDDHIFVGALASVL